MSDAQKSAVDRIYDTLEQGAVAVGAVLGVDVRAEASAERSAREARHARVPGPAAAAARALPSPGRARRAFEIIEAIDADTGKTTYTVTNGVESADCPSRAFAQQVLEALAAKGVR